MNGMEERLYYCAQQELNNNKFQWNHNKSAKTPVSETAGNKSISIIVTKPNDHGIMLLVATHPATGQSSLAIS